MSSRAMAPPKTTFKVTPTARTLLQRKLACGGAAGRAIECKKKLQRRTTGPVKRATAPPIVHEVLRSPGQPLDTQTRSFLEPRLGHDFSKVRVHADAKAAASAQSVNALAYTVGHDLVFGAGQYVPETETGRQLVAHELTHVMQQTGTVSGPLRSGCESSLELGPSNGPSEKEAALIATMVTSEHGRFAFTPNTTGSPFRPIIQRAPDDDEWAKIYGTHKSFLVKPYEEFKAGLGDVKSTTQGGLTKNVGRPIAARPGAGTPAAPQITLSVLKEIYPGLAADVAADPLKESKAQAYCDSLNQAFKIMKIDTVEAQSVYLAHAFIESDQFRQFTETQGAVDQGAQKWVDDPNAVKLDTSDLAGRYKQGGDVNPGGKFEFIGRGPVQATHRPEYVEAIAMLEKTAEQYDKESAAGNTQARQSAQLAHEAAAAVKADPRQAANPKYTFLFSAAFMKKSGADVSAAQVTPGVPWTGTDAASGWVAGGKQKPGSPQAKALIDKSNAYTRIYSVLLREARKASAAAPPP